jgi:hypothetical protein
MMVRYDIEESSLMKLGVCLVCVGHQVEILGELAGWS